MANDKIQIKPENFSPVVSYMLDQWLASVGTVGDGTTIEFATQLEKMDYAGLAKEFARDGYDRLSETQRQELLDVVQDAGCKARKILETDSIGQRISRSVGALGYVLGDGLSVVASQIVRGSDEILPPLAFSYEPPSNDRCR